MLRLTLRLFGLDVLELHASTDDQGDDVPDAYGDTGVAVGFTVDC